MQIDPFLLGDREVCGKHSLESTSTHATSQLSRSHGSVRARSARLNCVFSRAPESRACMAHNRNFGLNTPSPFANFPLPERRRISPLCVLHSLSKHNGTSPSMYLSKALLLAQSAGRKTCFVRCDHGVKQ